MIGMKLDYKNIAVHAFVTYFKIISWNMRN